MGTESFTGTGNLFVEVVDFVLLDDSIAIFVSSVDEVSDFLVADSLVLVLDHVVEQVPGFSHVQPSVAVSVVLRVQLVESPVQFRIFCLVALSLRSLLLV